MCNQISISLFKRNGNDKIERDAIKHSTGIFRTSVPPNKREADLLFGFIFLRREFSFTANRTAGVGGARRKDKDPPLSFPEIRFLLVSCRPTISHRVAAEGKFIATESYYAGKQSEPLLFRNCENKVSMRSFRFSFFL
jgi:hypothetical protein